MDAKKIQEELATLRAAGIVPDRSDVPETMDESPSVMEITGKIAQELIYVAEVGAQALFFAKTAEDPDELKKYGSPAAYLFNTTMSLFVSALTTHIIQDTTDDFTDEKFEELAESLGRSLRDTYRVNKGLVRYQQQLAEKSGGQS